MGWKLSNDRPIYMQLIDRIKIQILSGQYHPGDNFPTVRDLATQAAVNPNTMQKALASLELEGLLISSRTARRTVTTDQNLIHQMRNRLAEQSYEAFHRSMTELGFTESELQDFLRENYL